MKVLSILVVLVVLCASATVFAQSAGAFDRQWTYVSETSAVVYWALPKLDEAALSYVEYGKGQFDKKTPETREPRWAQFHRITGLETGATYQARMVNVDPVTKKETRSAAIALAPAKKPGAVYVGDGPYPILLDKPGATYVLTKDITAAGGAFEIAAPNVTLDLDGHTVTFGDDTDKQVFGIIAKCDGPATVANGHVAQGRRSGYYSAAVTTRWRPQPLEVSGVSTDVHLKCAYPVSFFGKAAGIKCHHNNIYSRVTELESRHYPGNDLVRLETDAAGDVQIHDNLLTEGCHIGIRVAGQGPKVEISYNDIRHHQQYTNGYAFAVSCNGADIHHNRVTSSGRAVHLTADGILFHDNWMDTANHFDLDDMPSKSRPFHHILVELHGIKFEDAVSKNCKVYGNFMRITQKAPVDSQGAGDPADKMTNGVYVRSKATRMEAGKLIDESQKWEKDRWAGYWVKFSPDKPSVLIRSNDATSLSADVPAGAGGGYTIYAKWEYVPATPLNVACYDPNAMNEVYGNTFVALTDYSKTQHGGYGKSGQWASAIYFVGMDHGAAEPGKYSIYIHDNKFISNDLFASTSRWDKPINMTVRIEKNTFELAKDPAPTEGHAAFADLGPELEAAIKAGGNKFQGMQP